MQPTPSDDDVAACRAAGPRHTPATAAIQRRLERWELDHLRLLARQQAEQIEELERRLSWAEDCAERWRDDALDLQTQLADDTGGAPGLTMSGSLVVVANDRAAAVTPTPPPIGHPWPRIPGSHYAGIAAAEGDGRPDGHIVLLPDRPAGKLAWADAVAWGESLGDGAHVPPRTEAALLYANLRDHLNRDDWHWTSTPYAGDDGSSCAWYCHFHDGSQSFTTRSAKGCAVAVRRFDARSFDPSGAA